MCLGTATRAVWKPHKIIHMLSAEEVGRGMAFPDSYVVKGNGREKVKQYGNAVVPVVARMLMRRELATIG